MTTTDAAAPLTLAACREALTNIRRDHRDAAAGLDALEDELVELGAPPDLRNVAEARRLAALEARIATLEALIGRARPTLQLLEQQ